MGLKLIDRKLYKIDFSFENIVQLYFKEDTHIDYDIALEVIEEIKLIVKNEIYVLLVISSKNSELSRSARNIFAKTDETKLKAVACLTLNTTQKIIANFYLKFAQPVHHTKFFESRNEALIWLGNFVKLEKQLFV